MMRFSKSLFAAALAAFVFALVGVANASSVQPAPGSATISNPGGRDFSGFLIVVEPSGRAWALDGAGHANGQLQSALAQALFADLASAGPLAQLPERNCAEALLIGWNGQRSSNLGCSADPRSVRLINDITAIQRALYVQSYRVASMPSVQANAYAPAVSQHMSLGSVPAGGYVRGSAASAPNSNYAAPSGFTLGSMNANGGGYFGGSGSIGFTAQSGGTFAPGSFSGNTLSGLNANGTFVGSGNLTFGQLTDTGRFSNTRLSGIGVTPSSTTPNGSFSNSSSFSNSNTFSNSSSGFQNQSFGGNGSTFNNGVGGSSTPR